MMMNPLALRYRPRVFEEVIGQDHPVRFLSGLIVHGQRCRNILLHGAIGSGKTTLARIYGKALNCASPTKNGSPCLSCASCQKFDREDHLRFWELDAPSFESRDHFEYKIDGLLRESTPDRRLVIFVDEAHSLRQIKGGFDFLLKLVEEPKPGTAFCFATTEFEQIPKALRSRLFNLELRPLTVDRAIGFLRDIADKEGICCEPEALALLAGLGNGQPRNMLQSLDQIRGLGKITRERVREVFGIDHTDVLTEYFLALATGDFSCQTKIMFAWNESIKTKIKLIQLFLLSLYYRELLKINLLLDPTIASISGVERRPIIQAFRTRLGADEDSLISFWQRMIEFWPVISSDQSDESLLMRLTMFQRLVSLPQTATSVGPTIEKPFVRPRRNMFKSSQRRTSHGHGTTPDAKADFLSFDQVRELFNAASTFTQEYGLLFNARITVRHSFFGCKNERDAAQQLSDFNREFAYGVKRWCASDLHRLAVQEHDDEHGYCGRIIAHVPDGATEHAREWLAQWRAARRTVESAEGAIEFLLPALSSRADRLRFHWKIVLWLCAGMNLTDDRLQHLKLKKCEARTAGLIGSQKRFSTSETLAPKALLSSR